MGGWPKLPPITRSSTSQDKKFAPYFDHFLMRYCVLKTILTKRKDAQVVFRHVFREDAGTSYAKKPNLEYTYATTEWEREDQPKAQHLIGFMIDHLYQLKLDFPSQSKMVPHLTPSTTPWNFEVWAANNGVAGWNGARAHGSHSAGEVAGPMVKEKFGFVVVPRVGDTPANLGGLVNYAFYDYNETLRHHRILDTCSCVVGTFAELGEHIPQTQLRSCGIEPPGESSAIFA